MRIDMVAGELVVLAIALSASGGGWGTGGCAEVAVGKGAQWRRR